ncbi:MAG: hypothetical protein JZU63_08965, partial [Rhodoferax sp.]|nr:hypothetical protein [Rhodoferax sp.]
NAGIYQVAFTASTNTGNFQLQQSQGGTITKVLFVELQQSGSDVQARIDIGTGDQATGAAYITGNSLGSNFSNLAGASSQSLASTMSTPSYGVAALTAAVKLTFTGVNSYQGATTLNN